MPRLATALVSICFGFCACGVPLEPLAGGESSTQRPLDDEGCSPEQLDYQPPPAPQIPVSASPVTADASTRMRRALLITDHRGLSGVEGDLELSLAGLLRDLGRQTARMACLDGLTEHLDDVEAYSRNPFIAAARDVGKHNDFETGPKIGTVAHSTNTWQTVLDHWVDGSAGPFRLLAVANRLDVAGDTDARAGGSLAALRRRWFGEGRLVFGTTNIGPGGEVLPVTVILEFRLPALRRVQPTGNTYDLELDPDFDWDAGPTAAGSLSADEVWRRQRRLWALAWRELIRHDPSSGAYQRRLHDLVRLFARGENFIALRTGENERDADAGDSLTTEFEYREFYLSNSGYKLTSRKNRREPMRCEDDTATLVTHLDDDWNIGSGLDFHFDFAPGQRTLTRSEEKEVVGKDGTGGACGGIPYGNGELGDVGFRANYVRFRVAPQNGFPATPAWQNAMGRSELKRHLFAARTCSGCHSSETGSPGFLVSPRASDDVDAPVAHFLNTDGEVHAVTVTANGAEHTYEYRELEDRLATFSRFLNQYDFSADYLAGQKTFANEMLFCSNSPCGADQPY